MSVQTVPKKALPTFSKSIGLDVIITASQKPYLVELQHGFGRRGLRTLYPQLGRSFRKEYFQLRQTHGSYEPFQKYLKKVSSNKTKTYRLLPQFQPQSMPYRSWNEDIEAWLNDLSSEFLLAKPPLGCCGEGIKVLNRKQLLDEKELKVEGRSYLLQEYIPSKMIEYEGDNHVGCIRHIMVVCCRDGKITLHHWPSYWRVAPVPYDTAAANDSMTANISRGAIPIKVTPSDEKRVDALCMDITQALFNDHFDIEFESCESQIGNVLHTI